MANRTAHQSTVAALLRAKNGSNLDAVAARYRFAVSKGTLSRALRGASVSEQAENDIRYKLGLPTLKTVTVEACPDCAGHGVTAAHTGRCHGRPVVEVVTLAHGEHVARKPTRVIRRWRDLPTAELAAAIANRQLYRGAE